MKQNDFEAYKKAVKLCYEEEKKGYYSSFLLQPSRANLRKLCVERLKENPSPDDLNSFKIFIGFDFKPENRTKLKDETDRFRTIENFLKGSSDSNDVEVINIAAILVDYTPRPFLKFVKGHKGEEGGTTVNPFEKQEIETQKTTLFAPEKKSSPKKKLLIGLIGFTAIFSIGYTAKDLVLPAKECMQWQIDHYEPIDCQSQAKDTIYFGEIEALNEKLLDFKKIDVNKNFPFFKEGKAVVWYCKISAEELEYFNGNGNGYHPITGKTLRPITTYMISKYVKN
jgi:hypothetical protein